MFATEREGFQGIQIVVSETGWPTGGGEAASVANAMAYNENVVRRVANYVVFHFLVENLSLSNQAPFKNWKLNFVFYILTYSWLNIVMK